MQEGARFAVRRFRYGDFMRFYKNRSLGHGRRPWEETTIKHSRMRARPFKFRDCFENSWAIVCCNHMLPGSAWYR